MPHAEAQDDDLPGRVPARAPVRDSRNPTGGVLAFETAARSCFVGAAGSTFREIAAAWTKLR